MTDQVYRDIAKKLYGPQSTRFLRVLESSFSRAEGEVILELFTPSTSSQVAERSKRDEKTILPILEELTRRGIIIHGESQYAFHSSVIAFHHHVVGGVGVEPTPDEMKKAWGDYFLNEWCDDIVQGYIDRQQRTRRPVFRVWPALGALEMSPEIKSTDLIPEEDFKLKLQNTKRIIVGHCGCRKNWAVCDHPIETCFAPSDGNVATRFLGKPNRTSIREVQLEEALEIVRKNEKAGLVHTGACFCCTCSCEILYSLKRANRWDLLGSSRFQAKVNLDTCSGCQTCVERCPFDAIQMQKSPGSKKLKATIIPQNCKGCGVCIVGCPEKASSYEMVRAAESIRVPRPPPGTVVGVPCVCLNLK